MQSSYEEIVSIISTIIKVDRNEINEKTNLFDDLHMDSLMSLEMVNQIEERWNFKLTDYPELLDEMETVESLVLFLENNIGGR